MQPRRLKQTQRGLQHRIARAVPPSACILQLYCAPAGTLADTTSLRYPSCMEETVLVECAIVASSLRLGAERNVTTVVLKQS
jgi:hypothetical protein